MTDTYTQTVERITDKWIEGIERATAGVPKLRENLSVLDLPKFDLPENELTDQFKSLTPDFGKLPSAEEIISTNFAVAQRLLNAQRDFYMAVVESFVPSKDEVADAAPVKNDAPATKPAAKKSNA